MTTRSATRCKAADYIFVYGMPFVSARQDGELTSITAISAHHVLPVTRTLEVSAPHCADIAASR